MNYSPVTRATELPPLLGCSTKIRCFAPSELHACGNGFRPRIGKNRCRARSNGSVSCWPWPQIDGISMECPSFKIRFAASYTGLTLHHNSPQNQLHFCISLGSVVRSATPCLVPH